MEATLQNETLNIEDERETNLILERLDEMKNGKVKSLDESIKNFIEERDLCKNIV